MSAQRGDFGRLTGRPVMSCRRLWCFLVHRWWVRTLWDFDTHGRDVYMCVRCDETWSRA